MFLFFLLTQDFYSGPINASHWQEGQIGQVSWWVRWKNGRLCAWQLNPRAAFIVNCRKIKKSRAICCQYERKIVSLQNRRIIIMETSTINTIRQYFATQPIKKAWLFGSCSRGEERADSDIDILVEYNDSDSISLLTISRIIAHCFLNLQGVYIGFCESNLHRVLLVPRFFASFWKYRGSPTLKIMKYWHIYNRV